ncbi:hypothetical protein AJ80_05861 [Polytolypa hystricis UAMH7299]|uniref:CENP-V/GFA domain-containing protein n=1 Tax=Polytolypa hystricis (strain UAMH7299) TaxID=1447883 RepID=A0A2B7Y0I6_POLH7|nr:hypothetical protein AJ80_05861 [Polytolypa hystricis UAMH7299]
MSTFNGACHCKEISYTVKLEQPSHILCHCDACKEINGGEFTLNQVVPEGDFQLIKGTLGKYTYAGDSGNPVHCYFCPNCTTHIYHHQTVKGPFYIVRTATLEGAKEWPVAAEVYTKNLAKWQPIVVDDKSKAFELAP